MAQPPTTADGGSSTDPRPALEDAAIVIHPDGYELVEVGDTEPTESEAVQRQIDALPEEPGGAAFNADAHPDHSSVVMVDAAYPFDVAATLRLAHVESERFDVLDDDQVVKCVNPEREDLTWFYEAAGDGDELVQYHEIDDFETGSIEHSKALASIASESVDVSIVDREALEGRRERGEAVTDGGVNLDDEETEDDEVPGVDNIDIGTIAPDYDNIECEPADHAGYKTLVAVLGPNDEPVRKLEVCSACQQVIQEITYDDVHGLTLEAKGGIAARAHNYGGNEDVERVDIDDVLDAAGIDRDIDSLTHAGVIESKEELLLKFSAPTIVTDGGVSESDDVDEQTHNDDWSGTNLTWGQEFLLKLEAEGRESVGEIGLLVADKAAVNHLQNASGFRPTHDGKPSSHLMDEAAATFETEHASLTATLYSDKHSEADAEALFSTIEDTLDDASRLDQIRVTVDEEWNRATEGKDA